MVPSEEAKIELARRHPDYFIEYTFSDEFGKPLKQGGIHNRWQKAMTDHKKVLIESPRDHGKTTQMIGRLIWELGKNPNLRISLVCANDPLAKNRLAEVRKHISENKKVQMVFPKLILEQENKTSIHCRRSLISKDPTVVAQGVLSAGTGNRADLTVFDDVCDRRNSLTVPALRKSVKVAYENDWVNLLPPHGRSWYIYTPWHKKDLSHQLLAGKSYHQEIDRVKIEFDDAQNPKKFKSVWPEYWTEKALLQRYKDTSHRAFMRGFCGQAIDEGDRIVKPEWIRYGWPKWSIANAVRIQSWDGAGTHVAKTDDPDYMAFVDAYVNELANEVYIANAWRGRGLGPREQQDAVLTRAHDGLPVKFLVIERVGQSALADLVYESGDDLGGAVLVPFNPKEKKTLRLDKVSSLFQFGRVLVDPSLRLDPENSNIVPMIEEIIDFGFATHDDLCDAVVQLLLIAKRIGCVQHNVPEINEDINSEVSATLI